MAEMAFLPVDQELSQTTSIRTFRIPVAKWTSPIERHTISFSEQVPCDTSIVGSVQMDLELTFYPRGSESSNGYVEVHFDIEAASLNQLATRLDEMFYEMSYAFVGKGQKSSSFETVSFTHPTYNTNHCSKYSGVYMNHHYKCDSVVDQFAENGFITLQLWTKFTKADKWQFETNASVQQIHHEHLIDYLKRSEEEAKPGDKAFVKLVCKGTEFKCAKVLLASQSAAFDAMFSHESKESLTGQVELEESTPHAVGAMLSYLKCARIPTNMEEHVFDIVSLAGRYLMDPLVRACENVMNDMLTVETAVRTLIAIDQHQLNTELREIVTDFMKDNISQIMKEADWKLFMSEYPNLVNEFIMDLAEERKRLADEVKEKREQDNEDSDDQLSSDVEDFT